MRKLYLFLIIVVSVLLSLPTTVAYGSTGLTVGQFGGKGLSPVVVPGETYKQTLTASIGKDASATDVLIEVLGYGSTEENAALPLLPEQDTSPYSARSFIQPARTSVHCEPGETKEAPITISIPDDIKPGGYYAILRFSTSPKVGSNNVGVIQAIVLTMKFTVTGGSLIHTGEIINITTNEATSGKPVEIYTVFKNTGNHHFSIKVANEVYDQFGKLIDTVYDNSLSPVPEGVKRIKVNFIPEQDLALGMYSIKSILTLEDGTLLDEATGTFEVKAPYVPPPAPAVVDLKPSTASTLNTEDGRISIAFPQGSVLADAQVSLRSNPPDQLPAAPANYTLGTTSFRVDGLTGLLVKPAAVKVKYSSADLAKAAGDPARLVLARWDEANSQWTVLKTNLDSTTQSLNTETNQFSIWAVLVGPPVSIPLVGASPAANTTAPTVSGGTSWLVIGAVILLAGAIGVFLTAFILRKSRKHH